MLNRYIRCFERGFLGASLRLFRSLAGRLVSALAIPLGVSESLNQAVALHASLGPLFVSFAVGASEANITGVVSILGIGVVLFAPGAEILVGAYGVATL